MRKFAFVLLVILTACGGGGGGSDSACAIGRIAGGEQCSDGSANIALIIPFNSRGEGLGHCTGSYISLTSVLTAAHCFPRGTSGVAIISRGNERFATSLSTHPFYNGSIASPFDMAILKTNAPLAGGGPLPILLSRNPVDGEQVAAYGYGLDESGDFEDRILNGQAPLKATFTTFAGYFNGTAAIVSSGKGITCSGDSGGPVVAKSSSGSYGIIGITRAGPEGCSAEEGRPSFLSSTQSQGAVDFITALVPDVAVN